ncbi:uncharacterized protein UBRO_03273 [Ustilago bromivora]|uniref:DUF1749-domain-containing protein n=1 Tax=Ustilago bromivora TaxID=307758 RepID=A0A1K0G2M0_9BASI|nr:uncharacterized protein UBRO_03273 [Ustilago bromivora]SYW83217.1 uncharacterized protein UBRO2_05108 [Ustilago bromivora]
MVSKTSQFPSALTGSLQLYQKKPIALPYFDTNPDQPNSLIFVPGLTDTIGTIPYLPKLVHSIPQHGFSLVQPQLTCNLGGYGQCTLEGDAQEIAACVSHLRSTPKKRNGKVVLMGHSTGCQDLVAYLLSSTRATSAETRIDGAILQAPVSDREVYEQDRGAASDQVRNEMDRELQHATQLVQSGQGAVLMPRKDLESGSMPTDPTDAPIDTNGMSSGNASAVLTPAMTAYRTWSLRAKGGHDDFFSSDLEDALITAADPGARTMGRAIHNLKAGVAFHTTQQPQILALIGEKDKYVPDKVADILLNRWNKLLSGTDAFHAVILQDANHQAASSAATDNLVRAVERFLTDLK